MLTAWQLVQALTQDFIDPDMPVVAPGYYGPGNWGVSGVTAANGAVCIDVEPPPEDPGHPHTCKNTPETTNDAASSSGVGGVVVGS